MSLSILVALRIAKDMLRGMLHRPTIARYWHVRARVHVDFLDLKKARSGSWWTHFKIRPIVQKEQRSRVKNKFGSADGARMMELLERSVKRPRGYCFFSRLEIQKSARNIDIYTVCVESQEFSHNFKCWE